jgi:hypothetical protein
VRPESAVTFVTNGPLSSAFSHSASTPGININFTGVYVATFFVTTTGQSQFALFLSGTVIPESIYGSEANVTGGPGQVIFSATAGQRITLRNHSSASGNIFLPVTAGGSHINVNASITIIRLA